MFVSPKTEWSSFPGQWQRPAGPALSGVRTRPWCRSWAAPELRHRTGQETDYPPPVKRLKLNQRRAVGQSRDSTVTVVLAWRSVMTQAHANSQQRSVKKTLNTIKTSIIHCFATLYLKLAFNRHIQVNKIKKGHICCGHLYET